MAKVSDAFSSTRSLLFKEYSRGGLLGRLRIGGAVSSERPFNEIISTEMAAMRGIPTHRIIAGGWLRVEGQQRCGLLVQEIEGAANLPEWLAVRRPGPTLRGKAARLVGEIVGQLHDSGIVHGDLNLANILVRAKAGRLEGWVVDFDKAAVYDRLNHKRRLQNLLRLYRSVQKWNRAGAGITEREIYLFLRSYCRKSDLVFSEWTSLLRGDSPLFLIHRLKWVLADALGLSHALPIGGKQVREKIHGTKN